MNKTFLSKISLLSVFIIFCQGSSLAQYRGSYYQPQEPTFREQVLNIGLNISANLALNTASIFYNVFVTSYASEMYQKWRIRNYNPNLKSFLPESDKRIVLPRNVSEIIDEIRESKFPERYENAPSNEIDQDRKHILFHGIKGVGKTTFAKRIAADLNAYFVELPAAQLNEDSVEAILNNITELGKKAFSEGKRLIVLFDELSVLRSRFHKDAKKSSRANVVDTLLSRLVLLPENIVCIGTTNNKYVVDDALLDRFKKAVTVELPLPNERKQMLRNYLNCFSVRGSVINSIRELTTQTEGFTGRDLSTLITEAHSIALTEKIKEGKKSKEAHLEVSHINKALKRHLPDKIFEIQRQIAGNNGYLKKEQYEPHHEHLKKENNSLSEKLEVLRAVYKELPEEYEITAEEMEEAEKEKEFEDEALILPTQGKKSVSLNKSFYQRYCQKPLTFSSQLLASKSAFAAYGGLAVGFAAYTLIKTGVLEIAPRLVYQ